MIYKLGGDVAVKARRKAFAAARPKTAPGAGVMAPKPAQQQPAYTLPQGQSRFAGPSAHLAQQPSPPPPSAATQASPAASIAHNQQRFRQGAQALQGKMQEARQQFQKGLGGVSSWFSGQRRAAMGAPHLPKSGPTPLPPVQTSGRVQVPGRPAVADVATFTKPDGTVRRAPSPQRAPAVGAGGEAFARTQATHQRLVDASKRRRGVGGAPAADTALSVPATPPGPNVFNNNDPHGEFRAPKPQPVKMPRGDASVEEWRRYTRGG